jgi:2-haloacid dehalogenase
MKYKVILFDADGTLFDFDRAERHALAKSFSYFDAHYDEPFHLAVYQGINAQIWLEFEKQTISADALKTERFRRYFDEVNLALDPKVFSDFYLDALSQSSFLLDGAEELVTELSRSCTLILLTNGLSSVQHPRFKSSPIYKFMSAIVVSEDVGIAKPNSGIFEHAIEHVDHTPKRSMIMVGDNLKSDIQGGINFGIDTCWFNPERKMNTTGIRPTYEIQKLDEIHKILI